MDNIVETKVTLSEDTVCKILTAEVAKVIMDNPSMIESIVQNVLFTRPPKRNSYDNKEQPTFFEMAVKKSFEPMMQELIKEQLQSKKPMLKKIISKALGTKLKHDELADRLIIAMSKFTANIQFYINND